MPFVDTEDVNLYNSWQIPTLIIFLKQLDSVLLTIGKHE